MIELAVAQCFHVLFCNSCDLVKSSLVYKLCAYQVAAAAYAYAASLDELSTVLGIYTANRGYRYMLERSLDSFDISAA